MAARELAAGDTFIWNDKLYNVKKVAFIRGRVKVFAQQGRLTLKPDDWLYMV
jgi:hypothetical protein